MTPATLDELADRSSRNDPRFPIGSRARIVSAYDPKLVGTVVTISYAGRSYADQVRKDGHLVVQAPELDAISDGNSFGVYCTLEPLPPTDEAGR